MQRCLSALVDVDTRTRSHVVKQDLRDIISTILGGLKHTESFSTETSKFNETDNHQGRSSIDIRDIQTDVISQ